MENITAHDVLIPFSVDDWFDPLEEAVRFQVSSFIERWCRQNRRARVASGRPYGFGRVHDAPNGHSREAGCPAPAGQIPAEARL